jgi:hypothetical protein
MKPDFNKRVEKYKERREKHKKQDLRTIKLIATTVSKILSNNSKYLTNKDIKDICIKVYNSYNHTKHYRVRNMINSPAISKQIENKLLDAYIARGIEPLTKVLDLTQKAEEVAKNTSDYMQIAKHYKEIAEIASPNATLTQKETIDYATLADSDELIEQKRTVTRTVTQAISPNSVNIEPKSEDLSNNDKKEE